MATGVSAPAEPRYRLRAIAEAAGVPFGPRPPGARLIAVAVDAGGVAGDADVTIRDGDTVLVSESPAPAITDELRIEIHRAAVGMGTALGCDSGIAVIIGLVDDEWLVVDVEAVPTWPLAAPGSVLLHCLVRVRMDAPRPAEADPVTAVHAPDCCRVLVQPGDTPQPGQPLAVIMASGADRAEALVEAVERLEELRCEGVAHTRGRLRTLLMAEPARAGRWHPAMAHLAALDGPWCTVLAPGLETTIQDLPGREGMWEVGVPPSGPIDDLGFRLANRAVGNAADAAGLECVLTGPSLRFHCDAVIALGGARMAATLDGEAIAPWRPITVRCGQVLRCGAVSGAGLRSYVAIRGGLDVPPYLGSRSTFTLARFGGHAGRALLTGDELPIGNAVAGDPELIPAGERPTHKRSWELAVTVGPHAAPDYLTPDGLTAFLATEWRVSSQSNRTGIRLDGPAPGWARADGGEAGLHPSNLHDNGYALGAVDLTGDTPVILGPDGPSCGGFACPVVVPQGERWKLGQLRPGDRLRLRRIDQAAAAQLRARPLAEPRPLTEEGPVICDSPAAALHPGLTIRAAGDRYVLLEYGPAELDLSLRLRAHLLQERLRSEAVPGIVDLVPGVRSLLVHFEPARLHRERLLALLHEFDAAIEDQGAAIPARTLHLPLSWDDPSTRTAIDIYMRTVNPDAPWCPWNIEFIRRINGLESVEDVRRIVYEATYQVIGLGDVYLGAPLATPVDPRHRLVTCKYNPARTWTPENAVGIGGAYLCIYGMEGPGGYQFVGRTVPVWNNWRSTDCFEPGTPWLLRQFDALRWYPVEADELLDLRADMRAGRWSPQIDHHHFDLAAQERALAAAAGDIAAFRQRQRAAFAAERAAWAAAGGSGRKDRPA